MPRAEILKQYNGKLGHKGVNKTYKLICKSYFWPGLYKEVLEYANNFLVCQKQQGSRSYPFDRNLYATLAFQKVSMDISGPYGETLKVYAIPDKKVQTVVNLISTEVFSW